MNRAAAAAITVVTSSHAVQLLLLHTMVHLLLRDGWDLRLAPHAHTHPLSLRARPHTTHRTQHTLTLTLTMNQALAMVRVRVLVVDMALALAVAEGDRPEGTPRHSPRLLAWLERQERGELSKCADLALPLLLPLPLRLLLCLALSVALLLRWLLPIAFLSISGALGGVSAAKMHTARASTNATAALPRHAIDVGGLALALSLTFLPLPLWRRRSTLLGHELLDLLVLLRLYLR